jgi:hypothetical protein
LTLNVDKITYNYESPMFPMVQWFNFPGNAASAPHVSSSAWHRPHAAAAGSSAKTRHKAWVFFRPSGVFTTKK